LRLSTIVIGATAVLLSVEQAACDGDGDEGVSGRA
jgi:hypothetical protein